LVNALFKNNNNLVELYGKEDNRSHALGLKIVTFRKRVPTYTTLLNSIAKKSWHPIGNPKINAVDKPRQNIFGNQRLGYLMFRAMCRWLIWGTLEGTLRGYQEP
jgi:hypothetical protein